MVARVGQRDNDILNFALSATGVGTPSRPLKLQQLVHFDRHEKGGPEQLSLNYRILSRGSHDRLHVKKVHSLRHMADTASYTL